MQNSNSAVVLPSDPLQSLLVLAKLLEEGSMLGDVVLIGGQALFLWSLRYSTCGFSELDQAYLTSTDLDFVIKTGLSIELLATTWGSTKYKQSTMDDHSPQAAVITFVDVDSNAVIVDILDTVLGFDSAQDVIKRAERLPVGNTHIGIMNPIDCLISRIANCTGRGYSQEKIEREVSRIQSAIYMCKAYLSERLDSVEDDVSMNACMSALKYLTHYCHGQNVKRFVKKFKMSLIEAIPLEHPKLKVFPYCEFIKYNVKSADLRMQKYCTS